MINLTGQKQGFCRQCCEATFHISAQASEKEKILHCVTIIFDSALYPANGNKS